LRDSPQARAISQTLRTSRSVASRIAHAGTDTTAIVWPFAANTLELVALRHVGTRRIDRGGSRRKLLSELPAGGVHPGYVTTPRRTGLQDARSLAST
jgi:hypothetical protein